VSSFSEVVGIEATGRRCSKGRRWDATARADTVRICIHVDIWDLPLLRADGRLFWLTRRWRAPTSTVRSRAGLKALPRSPSEKRSRFASPPPAGGRSTFPRPSSLRRSVRLVDLVRDALRLCPAHHPR
jgi:hypothetical protein